MFSKGSRYRILPEFTLEAGSGEHILTKAVRVLTTRPTGRFQHTVQENDRLDLLAFKYYGDPTKWWQISDANPVPSFPTEILDRGPIAEERLVLSYSAFLSRFTGLVEALELLGTVEPERNSSFEETVPREPDFVESTVVVVYAPSVLTRQGIVQEIKSRGFRCVRVHAWTAGTDTAETFTIIDTEAREQWRLMVEGLAGTAGVLETRSLVTEKVVELRYNRAMVERERILAQVQAAGFALLPESLQMTPVGTTITVPPNQMA